MSRLSRRTWLAGLLTVAAGCQGSGSSGDAPASTPTRTPSGTATAAGPEPTTLQSNDPYRTADGWRVRVAVYRARRGIVVAGDPHDRPLVPDDRQFLQLGVETSGEAAPAPEDLCLAAVVDGERPYDGCTARLEAVDPDKLGTLQAVPVPLSFAGDRAGVVWDRPDGPTVTWRVSDRIPRALRFPPTFVVEDITAPSTAAEGAVLGVEITVRNEGKRDDWFVAELGLARASDGREIEVPYDAGEQRTVTRDLTARFGDADALTVRLDWGPDAVERRVERA